MKLSTLPLRVGGNLPLKTALILTLARIVISPIFLVLYLRYEAIGIHFAVLPFILLSLLAVSELSDFLDGFIARKWNQVTDLGKILDPMADSIARISVFLAFTQGVVKLPLMLVLVFLYRDVFISMLRTLCALRGLTLAARFTGKLKAVIQATAAIAIVALMIPYTKGLITLELFRSVSLYIVSAAALYTVFSGIEYIYVNRRFIKQAWTK